MKIWREYIYPRLIVDIAIFFVPLMILGIIGARLYLNTNIWLGIIANYLFLAFAFMYNDIKDAKDDAKYKFQYFTTKELLLLITYSDKVKQKKGYKRFSNPFGRGWWSLSLGYFLCFLILGTGFYLSYLAGGKYVLAVGIINAILGVLYSGGIIRFKRYFLIDVVSHAILLAAIQIIYFYFYPGAHIDFLSAFLLSSVFIYSVAGDLWNEYRDFEEDSADGLKNTAIIIGKRNTYIICKVISPLVLLTMIVLAISIILGVTLYP